MGRLTSVGRTDGSSFNVAWNAAGAVQSLAYPGPQGATLSVDFSYDSYGKVSAIEGPGDVSLSESHDGPVLTSSTWSGPFDATVSRQYDGDFLVTERSVGDSSVSFAYDGDGLLVGAGDVTLQRNASTTWVEGVDAGAVSEVLTWSAVGDLTSVEVQTTAGTLYSVHYTYDEAGRVATATTMLEGASETRSYTYDMGARLTLVEVDDVVAWDYEYDERDNATQVTTGGGPPVTLTYDLEDRLLEVDADAVVLTYTAGGELTGTTADGETTTFAFDALGGLHEVVLPGDPATVISYANDGRGRRVARYVDGVFDRGWVYKDAVNPVAELDEAGDITARFIYASRGNIPDLMLKDGMTFRIIADRRGSPVLVVDASTGAIMQRITYDPWGAIVSDDNPGFQPFGFAGGLADPDTGLVRLGARDYSPAWGRFVTRDPSGFLAGFNGYAYGAGDPVNMVDSDGRFPFVPILIGALIGGGVDLIAQTLLNDEINWCSVAFSTIAGAAGGALAGGVAAAGATVTEQAILSGIGNAGIGGLAKAGQNVVEGKPAEQGVLSSALLAGTLEGAGSYLGGKAAKNAKGVTAGISQGTTGAVKASFKKAVKTFAPKAKAGATKIGSKIASPSVGVVNNVRGGGGGQDPGSGAEQ